MDGRVQSPVQEFLKKNFAVDYVDMITLPGANKLLAENSTQEIKEFVKRCLSISVEKHGSRLIAVAGHDDCAGNPACKEIQIDHTRQAMAMIKEWFPEVQIIGLWVNEHWQVELIERL